jgi:hypothetical protein
MKEADGHSLKKFIASFHLNGCFKGVQIIKSTTDDAKFFCLHTQFFQALLDNIEQRFPLTQFMQSSSVLNMAQLPSDPLQRALFGKTEIGYLCREFNIESTKAAQIVLGFSLYKRGHQMSEELNNFVQLLKALPISSAGCKRGFSQMNLHHTSLRNRLAVERVSYLLMISINGPPLTGMPESMRYLG